MNYKSTILNWLAETVFPVRCLGCRHYQSDLYLPYLCKNCAGHIKINKSSECIGCKRLVPHGLTCPLCRPDYKVDRLLIVLDYKQPVVQRLIKGLKYSCVPEISETLAFFGQRFLLKLVKLKSDHPFKENPLIIPVPLHRRRLNWRGFNQSQLIAKHLAHYFQYTTAEEILIRNRFTAPQADRQNRDDRLHSLVEAFTVAEPLSVSGRSILLIDDICTTGTTLNECAKALKAAGAHKVTALVIARG